MQKWLTGITTNEEINTDEEINTNEERANAPERNGLGSSWVNILLGIWAIISPFILGFHSSSAVWSNVVAGIIVGILALLRWGMHRPGWSWLNLILGIWLVISPFVLFLSAAAMWNNVILGIIVAAFALTNTYSKVSVET
jgi:hypothetical protein